MARARGSADDDRRRSSSGAGWLVALLALAPKLVQPLSWPALLVGLVVCIKVYWVALLWRRPAKNS